MKCKRNLLAFDLGASNGRAILGQFDGDTVKMTELHRFENYYIEMNGIFYWDLPYLLGYFLTGTIGSEYTIATTTQRYNPTTKDWEKAYQKLLTLLK